MSALQGYGVYKEAELAAWFRAWPAADQARAALGASAEVRVTFIAVTYIVPRPGRQLADQRTLATDLSEDR